VDERPQVLRSVVTSRFELPVVLDEIPVHGVKGRREPCVAEPVIEPLGLDEREVLHQAPSVMSVGGHCCANCSWVRPEHFHRSVSRWYASDPRKIATSLPCSGASARAL